MTETIIPVILGAFIIYLGLRNMTGDISSLHSYHRKRVSEEDRLPFGRMVGIGTVICGASIMLYALISFVAAKTQLAVLSVISTVLIVLGLVIGLGLNFWAMFKYNKGIF